MKVAANWDNNTTRQCVTLFMLEGCRLRLLKLSKEEEPLSGRLLRRVGGT